MCPDQLVQVGVLAVRAARKRPVGDLMLPGTQQLHARHKEGYRQGVELHKQERGHGVGEVDDGRVVGGVVQHQVRVRLGGSLENKLLRRLCERVLPKVEHQDLPSARRVGITGRAHVQAMSKQRDGGEPRVVPQVLQVVLVHGGDGVLGLLLVATGSSCQETNVLVQTLPLGLCAAADVVAVSGDKDDGLVEGHPHLARACGKAAHEGVCRRDGWVALVEPEVVFYHGLCQLGVRVRLRVEDDIRELRGKPDTRELQRALVRGAATLDARKYQLLTSAGQSGS